MSKKKTSKFKFDSERYFALESRVSRALLYQLGPLPQLSKDSLLPPHAFNSYAGQNKELEKEARAILGIRQDDPIREIDFSALRDEQLEAAHVLIHLSAMKRLRDSLLHKTGYSDSFRKIEEQIAWEERQLTAAAIRSE